MPHGRCTSTIRLVLVAALLIAAVLVAGCTTRQSTAQQLRVQVLAPGYQTFGDDYLINQPQQEIVIKLKAPQGQYSIYK